MKSTFEWKNFIKSLLAIAIPVALQNLLTTTSSIVDTMMIAPLGQNSVGALGLCSQFSMLLFSCYWGFVGGGILFFAQYRGAKDDDGLCRAFGTTIFAVTSVGIIFFALGLIFPNFVLNVYTDKVEIQKIGIQYVKIVAFSYLFTPITMGISALLRATGKPRIPLLAAIISVGSNIFFNWVFIYGNLGAKPMGVQGAALATVIASLVNVIMLIVPAKVVKYPYLFMVNKFFNWNLEWIKIYIEKCYPIIINEILYGIGNMIINIVIGRQSKDVIAAIAVFHTLEGMVIAFFAGLANSSSILVGSCVGAGKLKLAYERAKRLVWLCVGCISVVCMILVAVRKPVLNAMGLKGNAYTVGYVILCIYAVFAVIRMTNWFHNEIFRCAGDPAFGSLMEIAFMFLMVVPAVCTSGLVLKLPYYIIFVCCFIDEPIRFVIMQIHLYSKKWIKPVTEQGISALKELYEN